MFSAGKTEIDVRVLQSNTSNIKTNGSESHGQVKYVGLTNNTSYLHKQTILIEHSWKPATK